MKSSKTRQVSNTVAFSSIFLSLVVCFVALVHVEFELHAHRQMLQVLSQKRRTILSHAKLFKMSRSPYPFTVTLLKVSCAISYFISYIFTDGDVTSTTRHINPFVRVIPRPQMIPKMDRKWSSTVNDPQHGPQMIQWKLRNGMDLRWILDEDGAVYNVTCEEKKEPFLLAF